MKKILVLGSTGMLGQMVFKVLSQEKKWEAVEAKNFKVGESIDALEEYEYIVNCIGILTPMSNIEQAIRVNAVLPHELARTTKGNVLHMSTNGVFSGKGGPYNEGASHDCADVYGRTKSLGEVNANHVLNIRTSIIGPSPIKKRGLFEWFRGQPDNATIQGYTNHYWNGVTTLQFAELCRYIISGNHFGALRREGPALHFAPNQTVTKYELLTLFQKLLQKRITIQPTEDPRGARAQLLACTSKILPSFSPYAIPMERAITDLLPYC